MMAAWVAFPVDTRFCPRRVVVGWDWEAGQASEQVAERSRLGGCIGLFETGGYRSGQTGQTVNLLAHAFAGSNPAPPTV
jgi:hypothetical protein